MKNLFQTFFVLLTLSSQANATPLKLYQNIDSSKFLPFSESNRAGLYSKDLQGLYNIKAFQSAQIKQPYSEFNQLYQHAYAAQRELEMLTARIALQSKTATLSSGIKSKLRTRNKINNKLAGHSEQITDLVRTSIVAKDVPALIESFELLEQETQLLRVKNRFKTPGKSGYRDLSLLVRLPESQMIAEIQLHLEAFSVIKNGKEHNNYERIQQIERLQLTGKRTLSEIEQAAVNKLRKESQQLYQQAWNQYLSA